MLEARERSRLTQRDAAAIVGCSEQAIGSYERGLHMPDARKLHGMCVAYGVSADWLLGLE